MNPTLPKILPVNELKNTANILKTCKESTVPIVITKNGYGEAILMSIDLYEELIAKIHTAILVNESLDNPDNESKELDADVFFKSLVEKYGNK